MVKNPLIHSSVQIPMWIILRASGATIKYPVALIANVAKYMITFLCDISAVFRFVECNESKSLHMHKELKRMCVCMYVCIKEILLLLPMRKAMRKRSTLIRVLDNILLYVLKILVSGFYETFSSLRHKNVLPLITSRFCPLPSRR